MGNKKIPDGWHDYSKWGTVIAGTKFFPFKVPLKAEIAVPYGKEHTPKTFIESNPNVKMIINLTDTPSGRYYHYEDFTSIGIPVYPIRVRGGGQIPSSNLLLTFADAVQNFMATTAKSNPDALIGVHCTHGLNRTGYFICKYMILYMGIPPKVALERYNTARGHPFDRQEYMRDILNTR